MEQSVEISMPYETSNIYQLFIQYLLTIKIGIHIMFVKFCYMHQQILYDILIQFK